jgi:hypothetical protein
MLGRGSAVGRRAAHLARIPAARRASTGGEPPATAPGAVVSAVSSRGMSASAISSVAMKPIASALSEQLCRAASAFGSMICSECAASFWAPPLGSELTHLRSPWRAGPSMIRVRNLEWADRLPSAVAAWERMQ